MSVGVWPIKHRAATPLQNYSAAVHLLIPQLHLHCPSRDPRTQAKMGEQSWASNHNAHFFSLPIPLFSFVQTNRDAARTWSLEALKVGPLLKCPSRKGLILSKNEKSFHVALPHPTSD